MLVRACMSPYTVHKGAGRRVYACLHILDKGEGMGKGVGEMVCITRAWVGGWGQDGVGVRVRLCTCAAGRTFMCVACMHTCTCGTRARRVRL